MKMIKFASLLLVSTLAAIGVAGAEENVGALLAKKAELEKQVEETKKEYEPQLKPLNDKINALYRELREKTKPQDEQITELNKTITEEFQKYLPKGEQSYGNFDWTCSSHSWIQVYAKKDGKQKVWVQVFYRPEMTPEKQKQYGSKECHGYPAKRYKDKWVWIQCGKVEMRLGLSDTSLESDATLDAIMGSFDLDGISKL